MIEQLKVGHRLYGVEWPEDRGLEDDNCWAEHDTRCGMIRVATHRRPPDALAESLLHEVLHALLEDSGGEWSGKVEERIVGALSPRLAAFIRDNPEAVREITRMLSE